MFPRFFEMCADSREFLLRQPDIHGMLAAGLHDVAQRKAIADKFAVVERSDSAIEVTYRSANRLCALYRSLAHASARVYGETLSIETQHCACKDGGDHCKMIVTWAA